MQTIGDKLIVYTDGSCRLNTGVGAWGFLVVREDDIIIKTARTLNTTNNRMELKAIIEALRYATVREQDIIINTDSQYCIECVQRWQGRWFKMKEMRESAKNPDLWDEFFVLFDSREINVEFKFVKGHNGDYHNELIDKVVNTMSK